MARRKSYVTINEGEYCKLGIEDGQSVEHMWVLVTEVKGKSFTGVLHNTPVVVTNCDHGDIVRFDYEDIEDVYVED